MENQKALSGISFMMLNTLALAFLDITAKHLHQSLSSSHIVFLYKGLLLLMILPWVLRAGIQGFKTERIHVHMLRSLFSVLGSLCFVHGLKFVHMADAAALENFQYILLAVIGMLFFDERRTKTKVMAVVIGFIGAMIVVNPGFFMGDFGAHGFNAGHGYVLAAIFFWSMNSVTVKLLGRTEKNKTQMFYLMLFAVIWASPFALINWETVPVMGFDMKLIPTGFIQITDIGFELGHIKYLVFMGLCYFIHGTAYFNALKCDISIVVPFRYTKLIFSGLLGYLMFAEVQGTMSYVGYALIVTAGLMLIRYEYRKVRAAKVADSL